MADFEWSNEELLEQARGNQTAIWHLATAFARERDGSVDAWGEYVGRHFAPSWDEMGDDASAHDVAEQAAFNMATTADMRPVSMTGDEQRTELVLEGPDAESLADSGASREDIDRTNELVFRAIAAGRGMTLEFRRDGERLHLVFAKRGGRGGGVAPAS